MATRSRSLCTKQQCYVGSGPRYQNSSNVFARCPSQTTHGHAIARVSEDDRATFILWDPDFGPFSSTNGSTAFEQDAWISAGWPGGGPGKEGPALLFLSPPLAAAQVEAQLEGLLLLLALAGPAGYLKNALLRRRLGCCAADCA